MKKCIVADEYYPFFELHNPDERMNMLAGFKDTYEVPEELVAQHDRIMKELDALQDELRKLSGWDK